MDNKPKMYQNRTNKIFNNNLEMYMTSCKNDKKSIIDSNQIRKKINNIINSNDFIYRTKVNIVLDNEIITRKIIGIANNNLITIDNEYIPIESIVDIYK